MPSGVAKPGRCSEHTMGMLGRPLSCDLAAGHFGMHHDDATGADWQAGRLARCGHAIIADRYDEPNRCTLHKGHDGEHTDGYYVWGVRTVLRATGE